MRRIIGLAIAVYLASVALAFAQQSQVRFFTPYDDERVSVSSTSIGFTTAKILPTNPWRAEYVMCKVVCQSTTPCELHVRSTGAAATATTGVTANAGDTINIYGYNAINKTRFIRTTNDSFLYCTYNY